VIQTRWRRRDIRQFTTCRATMRTCRRCSWGESVERASEFFLHLYVLLIITRAADVAIGPNR